MIEFNEKPFTVFKGKTGESIKATYTGEGKEDAEQILALVDLRDSLRRFIAQTGQSVEAQSDVSVTDEEDPIEILQEIRSMLGVVQKHSEVQVQKGRFDASVEAVDRLNRILEHNDIRDEVIRMLLDGKTSRDIRDMIDGKRVEPGGGPTIGRAVSSLFAYRSRATEFIKKHRPETTDEELKKLYAKLP